MTTEQLRGNIRVIEDFPVKGIHFQDVTTLFQNPECLKELADSLVHGLDCRLVKKPAGLGDTAEKDDGLRCRECNETGESLTENPSCELVNLVCNLVPGKSRFLHILCCKLVNITKSARLI